MARAKKATEAPTDPLDAMLARLQLSGIRDQLDSLLDEAARANLSARETLILLCEREIARKDHRRIDMALKLAHFPAVKELAAFDFEAQPSIDPKQIRDLAASRWIANGENVLLLGPPGVGKTHLSIALGREAILAGYTVQFTTATTLAAGLAKAHGEAARANLSARETLILLCEREIARKDHRRIDMALKLAHFPAVKELAAFDFEAQPSIDPKQIRDLAASRWIANGENVLLLGPPGVGKTHLSIALGREAILAGYTVQFTTATTLAAGLAKAHGERRLDERLLALSKPKLLIVDELGYLPLEPDAAHLFFQLVSRRYETGAMLITSNRSVAEWGTVFADPVVATAILDRLLHHSHVLTIRGDSYRLRAKRKSGLIKPLADDGPPVGSASRRPVTGETTLQP